jgi:hypothetical protein
MSCSKTNFNKDRAVHRLPEVVQVITTGKIKEMVGNALIKRIQDLLALNWKVQISHIYRETNRYA